LLLAIVSGSPSFGSAYMEDFPYNLEDFASPTWSVSLCHYMCNLIYHLFIIFPILVHLHGD